MTQTPNLDIAWVLIASALVKKRLRAGLTLA